MYADTLYSPPEGITRFRIRSTDITTGPLLFAEPGLHPRNHASIDPLTHSITSPPPSPFVWSPVKESCSPICRSWSWSGSWWQRACMPSPSSGKSPPAPSPPAKHALHQDRPLVSEGQRVLLSPRFFWTTGQLDLCVAKIRFHSGASKTTAHPTANLDSETNPQCAEQVTLLRSDTKVVVSNTPPPPPNDEYLEV